MDLKEVADLIRQKINRYSPKKIEFWLDKSLLDSWSRVETMFVARADDSTEYLFLCQNFNLSRTYSSYYNKGKGKVKKKKISTLLTYPDAKIREVARTIFEKTTVPKAHTFTFQNYFSGHTVLQNWLKKTYPKYDISKTTLSSKEENFKFHLDLNFKKITQENIEKFYQHFIEILEAELLYTPFEYFKIDTFLSSTYTCTLRTQLSLKDNIQIQGKNFALFNSLVTATKKRGSFNSTLGNILNSKLFKNYKQSLEEQILTIRLLEKCYKYFLKLQEINPDLRADFSMLANQGKTIKLIDSKTQKKENISYLQLEDRVNKLIAC